MARVSAALLVGVALAFAPARPVRPLTRRSSADEDEPKIIADEDEPKIIDMTKPPPKHRDPIGNEDALSDRFLMAARALRGEFDPSDPTADTEDGEGLLSALVDAYPTPYSFTAVGKLDGDDASSQSLVDSLVSTIQSTIGADVGVYVESCTPRLNGRFASVKLTATVSSPEQVADVFAALKADARVSMTF